MAFGTMQIGDVARPPEETCIHVRDSIEQKSGDVRSKMTELHRLETELSAAPAMPKSASGAVEASRTNARCFKRSLQQPNAGENNESRDLLFLGLPQPRACGCASS
jgi:hypothetical protein